MIVADAGVNETAKSGVGAVVPVPLNETECGLPGAVSVIVTEPERLPVAVGVNLTLTVQLAPALSVVQLLVCEKSPLAVMPLMVSAAFPLLEILKLLATLVVLSCCAVKITLEAESASNGPVAVLHVPPAGAMPVPPLNSNAPMSITPTVVLPSAQAG